MEPLLCSQWKRLFGAPLPEELERLRECQSSAMGFLSSGRVFPLSGPPWISAAFLHCTVQQQSPRGRERNALKRLGTDTEQLLVSLLFFSLMDLISAKIAPKEGVDFQTSLEWALEILQCLEERGISWPLLFLSAEEGSRKYSVLHSAASDRHSRLLPVAFYSLTPGFHHKLLTREHVFLYVALNLYIQLLQLFVEGKDLPQPEQFRRQGLGLESDTALGYDLPCLSGVPQADPLEVISAARRFLLGAIPRCPAKSFGNVGLVRECFLFSHSDVTAH